MMISSSAITSLRSLELAREEMTHVASSPSLPMVLASDLDLLSARRFPGSLPNGCPNFCALEPCEVTQRLSPTREMARTDESWYRSSSEPPSVLIGPDSVAQWHTASGSTLEHLLEIHMFSASTFQGHQANDSPPLEEHV